MIALVTLLACLFVLYANRTIIYTKIAESPLMPLWDWYRAELRGQKYEHIQLPAKVLKTLTEHGITVRRPYSGPIPDRPSTIRHYNVNTSTLRGYAYQDYSVELAEYLNSPTTLAFMKNQRRKMIQSAISGQIGAKRKLIERYKRAIGYNDDIPSTYTASPISSIRNRYGKEIEELAFKSRFQSTLRVFRGKPSSQPKGILIALHGGLSSPEAVLGLSQEMDYVREFGAYWLQHGFIVYAPQVLWGDTLNMERLGFSPWGADVANIIDLIRYIRDSHGKDLPLIVSGISNGGITAEAVAIISDDIDGVVLNGSNARIDFLWNYNPELNPACVADPYRVSPYYCNDKRQLGYDYPAKPLGCYGDGGALLTKDEERANIYRSIRAHGSGGAKYDIARIGTNSRLDTLQAAILLAKLPVFEEEIGLRTDVANRYDKGLANVVKTPTRFSGRDSAWAQYGILTEQRDGLAEHLKQNGIPTAIYYPLPMHLQTAYRQFGDGQGSLPVSEHLSKSILNLPIHPYLDRPTSDRIIGCIKEFFSAKDI
jgi:alpha-beta hydrolase superfamily lysophospholipase